MSEDPGFDAAKAHRYFSVDCFNNAWTLIEKRDRTPEEDEQMIRLNQASLWHWTQRPDCTKANLSIGYWQASRIYAILGRAGEAGRYAQLCLRQSAEETPFLLGYAYEALARAEKLGGNSSLSAKYREDAVRLAASVEDEEERKMLQNDLETI